MRRVCQAPRRRLRSQNSVLPDALGPHLNEGVSRHRPQSQSPPPTTSSVASYTAGPAYPRDRPCYTGSVARRYAASILPLERIRNAHSHRRDIDASLGGDRSGAGTGRRRCYERAGVWLCRTRRSFNNDRTRGPTSCADSGRRRCCADGAVARAGPAARH